MKEKWNNLYVKNLPESFKDEFNINKLFSKFGRIASTKVEGNSMGVWAFVSYTTDET